LVITAVVVEDRSQSEESRIGLGLAALGVTELVYQPAGSDIERELRVFAAAAGLSG
jgi:hypothetical protein